MARRSAVLTPEGKKEALSRLKTELVASKGALKAAEDRMKQLISARKKAASAAKKADLASEKELAKAKKEAERAAVRHEVNTKSLTELKAQVVTPSKPAAPAATVQAAAPSTQQ